MVFHLKEQCDWLSTFIFSNIEKCSSVEIEKSMEFIAAMNE
jgi:hypothetical protein